MTFEYLLNTLISYKYLDTTSPDWYNIACDTLRSTDWLVKYYNCMRVRKKVAQKFVLFWVMVIMNMQLLFILLFVYYELQNLKITSFGW